MASVLVTSTTLQAGAWSRGSLLTVSLQTVIIAFDTVVAVLKISYRHPQFSVPHRADAPRRAPHLPNGPEAGASAESLIFLLLTMMYASTFTLSLLLTLLSSAAAVPADTKPECKAWSEAGECETNSEFMNANCATSCDEAGKAAEANAAKIADIESFFDLSAKNIEGEVIQFSELEGMITVITNVASHCGYTDSHYKGLKELHEHFENDFVEIMVFPCNQFGQQEPGTAQEISQFCEKKGFHGTVMEKIDVNGPNSHPVYLFLKQEAGPPAIKWNFATYYVIDHRGNVDVFNGIEPIELIPNIEELLDIMEEEEEEL